MNTFQTKGANELQELQELIIEAEAVDITNPHAVGAITTFQNTVAKIKEFADSKPTNPEKIKIKTKQLKQAIEQFYRDNLQGSKDKLNQSLDQAHIVLLNPNASNEARTKLEQLMAKVQLQQNTDDIKEINKIIANLESAINDVDISIKMLSELNDMISIAKQSVNNPHAHSDIYIQLQKVIGEAEKIVKNSANNGEVVNNIHAKLKLAIDEFNLASLQGSLFVLKASFEKAQETLQKPGASSETYINLKQVIEEAQNFIDDEPKNVDDINAMITKIMRATSEFNLSGTVKIVSELKDMILVAKELAAEPFIPSKIYIELQDVIHNAQQVVDNNFDHKQMVVRALDQLESKIDEINRFMLDETLYLLSISLENAQDALKQQGASNEARANLLKVIEEVEIFINEEPVDIAEVNKMINKMMLATSEFNLSGTVKILAKLDKMISQAVELMKAGESTIDKPTLDAFKTIVLKAQAVVKNNFTDEKIIQEMLDELEEAMDAFHDATFEAENEL